MDREQAIFILTDQATKHGVIAETAEAMDDPIIARDHKNIEAALRYAISVLRGAEKEAE